MDGRVLVLAWDDFEPWVYGCRQLATKHEVTVACAGRDFLAKKQALRDFERVVIAIHPRALQLVSINVVGTLSKRDFKRHKRHCLAASLDKKARGQQCFSLATAQLANSVCKHWVGAFDVSRLLVWWEQLYRCFRIKPTVVVPVLQLKTCLEKERGLHYPDVALLLQEQDLMALLIYRYNQLVFYCRFSNDAGFTEQWQVVLEGLEFELPKRILVFQQSERVGEELISALSWSGKVESIEAEVDLRHNRWLVWSSLCGIN